MPESGVRQCKTEVSKMRFDATLSTLLVTATAVRVLPCTTHVRTGRTCQTAAVSSLNLHYSSRLTVQTRGLKMCSHEMQRVDQA